MNTGYMLATYHKVEPESYQPFYKKHLNVKSMESQHSLFVTGSSLCLFDVGKDFMSLSVFSPGATNRTVVTVMLSASNEMTWRPDMVVHFPTSPRKAIPFGRMGAMAQCETVGPLQMEGPA